MRSHLIQLGLPCVLTVTRSQYWRLAREIRRRQYWPVAQMTAWQEEQLARLLKVAGERTVFYRERLSDAGIDPSRIRTLEDLQQLPVTTKTDIQQQFPDGVVTSDEADPDWRVVGTRGTTNRLMVVHDFLRRDQKRAADTVVLTEDCPYRLGQKQVSIPPDACSALCGIEGLRETSVLHHLAKTALGRKLGDPEARSDLRGLVMNNWIERATILEPFGSEGTHIDEERLDSYLSRIESLRPSLLRALPEYLQALARRAKTTGQQLSIPVIRAMGANLDAVSRQQIEEQLGGQVREHYGCVEFGGMAFDCHCRCGMHVLSSQFLIEVTRGGRPVDEGTPGSVLITDLHNLTMPMIRYEIGDIGTLTTELCPCGRTTPRLLLEGRLEDTIVTDDGRLVTPELAARLFYSDPHIEQFQLIEDRSGRLELRYVAAEQRGGSTVDPARLEQMCRKLVGAERRVAIREVRSILPESSGKFRHTKSTSYVRLPTNHTPGAAL